MASGATGWLVRSGERLMAAGALPGDSDDQLRKKRLLLLVTLAKCAVCPFWYGAYFAVGAPLPALGPLAYQVFTLGSVAWYLKRKDFSSFRLRQETLILVAPLWIHVLLGGFFNSSGVILWSTLSPLIAVLFHGGRESLPWFLALTGAIIGLVVADPWVATLAPAVPQWAKLAFFIMNFGVVGAILYAALRYYAALLDSYLRGVAAVTSASTAVTSGTFDPASLDEVGRRHDALGNLARLFQRMGIEVAARERRLRDQVEQLTIAIDERKKAEQVAEITDSDYFRDLQERVNGSWRFAGDGYFKLDAKSRSVLSWHYTDRSVIDRQFRVHFLFIEDKDHLENWSRWVYFRVVS